MRPVSFGAGIVRLARNADLPCGRKVATCLLLMAALLVAAPHVQAQTTVTDIRGRQVTIPAGPPKLLIDDGRMLLALALIHPDPVSLIAAWPHDSDRLGQQVYERLRARSPQLDRLTRVPSSAATFSLEQAIAARPSVAVYTLGRGPSDAQLRQFEAAKIPVVFVDFLSQPFEHVERSLAILGQIAGRTEQAEQFLAWRRARMARISDAVAASSSGRRPKVFFEAHAGISACCNSPGRGNIGTYITFVGGHNIGADVLPGASGRLNVEYVVSQQPDVYIMTGGPHLAKAGGYVVGPEFDVDESRRSLRAMLGRTGLGLLPAVKAGRVYGLSHQLLNSPLDILAVESLAAWIRPDLFPSLDPAATLRELNERFLAVPLEGPLWTTLH